MEILAIIPARGGSKGIPHKNIVDLCGKPLIQYTIEAAQKSQQITRCILSTDDREIADVGRKLGAEIAWRPPELAGDSTVMKDVISYHLTELEKSKYQADILTLLQPTSPLRTAKHIDEALGRLIDEKEADATVSVIPVPHLFTPQKIMQIDETGYLQFYMSDGEKYTTRQEIPQFYARNGAAIYAVYVDTYKKTKSLYGTKCLPYYMNIEDSVDIDDADDLELARFYLTRDVQKNDNKEKE